MAQIQAIVFIILGIIVVVCLVTFCAKSCNELLEEDDPVHDSTSGGGSDSQQVQQDRQLALQIQRQQQTNDSNGKNRNDETRKKRRECYRQFLKSRTMMAREEDFKKVPSLNDTNDNSSSSISNIKKPKSLQSQSVRWTSNTFLQLPATSKTTTTPVDDEDNNSIKNSTTTPPTRGHHYFQDHLVVEPSCAICLLEYEVGDAIVWSSEPNCPHAFHQDCMLDWLSTGKKRCPVCRDWFVPQIPYEELLVQQQQQKLKKQQLIEKEEPQQQPSQVEVQLGIHDDNNINTDESGLLGNILTNV